MKTAIGSSDGTRVTRSPSAHGGASAAASTVVLCAVVVVTVTACLIMLEVGLRVSGRYGMGNLEGFFAPGPAGITYVLKSNSSKRVNLPTTSYTVNTSDFGFRTRNPGHYPVGRRPYYVVLGASDAFGNGLDYDQTFIGVLDAKLSAHNIDVVNLAVGAHSLRMQKNLFKEFMSTTSAQPQAVLIIFNPLFIGGFDRLAENIIVKRGDLYDKESWKAALVKRTLTSTSASLLFFRDAIRNVQMKYLDRDDFSLDFYVETFSAHHSIRNPARLEAFTEELERFEDYTRALGAEPIFVYSPPPAAFLLDDLAARGKLAPGLIDTKFFPNLIEAYSKRAGLRFVNLAPPLQARYEAGEKLNIDLDGHLNASSSRLVGDYLYDALMRKKASIEDGADAPFRP